MPQSAVNLDFLKIQIERRNVSINADKKQIWVNGQFVEITEEVYAAYTQGDRKIRYFETDLKVKRTMLNKDGTIKKIIPSREDSLDRLMDDNAEQYADEKETLRTLFFGRLQLKHYIQLCQSLQQMNGN